MSYTPAGRGPTKNFHSGWVFIRPQGTETVNINIFVDKEITTSFAYLVTNDGDYIVTSDGDKLLMSVAVTATGEGMWSIVADPTKDIQNSNYRLGVNGLRIQFEVFNENVNESFFINELAVDFRELAARWT